MLVYANDIIIISNERSDIHWLKQNLSLHFKTKGLGLLKYCLGIKVDQPKTSVAISHLKYDFDKIEETGLLDCRRSDTSMDRNIKQQLGQGKPLKGI